MTKKDIKEIERDISNKELEDKEELFTVDLICELIEKATGRKCDDMYQAGKIIWDVLFQGREAREKLFKTFLDVSTNVKYDWFNRLFQQELAERTKKKQDYTNHTVANLTDKLTQPENDNSYSRYDVGAGTGTLTIAKWNGDRYQHSPFNYKPSMYWYVAEEYKAEDIPSYVLPFLLFNFLIRGMNGAVVAGDSLTRTVSQVFFIQNLEDNHLGFSSLNVMPRTKEVEKEFDIRKWIDEPIDYVEDTNKRITQVAKQSKEKAQQQYQHDKDKLDKTLNVVKQQNNNNPNAKKMKDLPKDEKDNLADNLDGILRIFGITPDPNIRKQYFGD